MTVKNSIPDSPASLRTSLVLAGALWLGCLVTPRPPAPSGAGEPLVKTRAAMDKDGDYERITDEEYARRARQSPDQVSTGTVMSRPTGQPARSGADVDWTSPGPRPITGEYWSGGESASGRICALLVDPRNPQVVYAGAAQGGIWKSTDAGVNWTPMSDFLSSLATGALTFDPTNPDIIYYGTGEQHFSGDSFYGDGLFRSADAGVSWTKIASKTSVGSYIARVAVDLFDPNTIYVASDLGLVRSTDGGSTWSVRLGPGYCTDIALDPVTSGVLYVGFRRSGVWKSTNSGTNWTKLTTGMPATGFTRLNIALAPSNHLVLYASFASPDGGLYGMYRTFDGGAGWTHLAATPDYLHTQGDYDNCLIVDPADPDICYAGGTFPFGGAGDFGLIKTVDGGATWNDINVGVDGSQPHPDHQIMAFGPDGRLWLGNDGGVWYTSDGGLHWVDCNSRLAVTQFYTATLHPTNPNILLGGNQDNGVARFEGTQSWPQVTAGDGGPCAIEWDSPNIYYTSYVQLSQIYKFDNGSYQGEVSGPWAGERASWCNAPFVVDPNQANTLLVGTHRVWRTMNSGGSWTALSSDLTDGNGYLLAIAIAPGASNTIYAASSDGRVYLTTDADTWDPRDADLPIAPFPDIVISPGDWQTAYLCADQESGDRVFRTTDAGLSWNSLTGDLPTGLRAMSLAVDFRPTVPRLYLGTDYGTYSSHDEGLHWVKSVTELPNLAVYDISVDAVNNLLVVGTHGRGMWRAALDVTPPEATLTAPAGGETWEIGSTRNITWTASDPSGIDSISLLLSRDGGASYSTVIAEGLANTGSFAWLVPGPASSTCRVKLIAHDGASNTGFDATPANFAIADPTSGVEDGAGGARTILALVAGNPARPPTLFRYQLARPGTVSLRLFDPAGRLVRVLDEGARSSGWHVTAWDGRNAEGNPVQAGVFFYQLRAEGFLRTERMIVVR